jgi:hypothetical protein
MSKRLFATLVVICAAALPVANALSHTNGHAATVVPHPFLTGIADQHANMFIDQRFLKLPISHVRIFVAWDLLKDPSQTAPVDLYMKAAHADNQDVLVTFTQSRLPGKHSVNPTPAQLVSSLKAMRKRWPWVHEFSTWNEVNLNGKKPATVAKWWMALSAACPTCTILGADLVDRGPQNNAKASSKPVVTASISTWLKGFLKATKGKQPKAWGLHNYDDANLKHTYGTQAMLKAVTGQIWFTETGGLVSRHSGSPIKLPEGQTHATAATKYILTTLARLSPRIKRVYLYEWTDATSTWDSAFTNPKNQTRSSLVYLTQFLTGSSTVPSATGGPGSSGGSGGTSTTGGGVSSGR